MRRGSSFSVYHSAGGIDWVITGSVTFGSRGSYWQPPEGDEVEFDEFVELDLGTQHGAQPKLSFDDWVERYGVSESDISTLEEKACEAAAERYDEDRYEE